MKQKQNARDRREAAAKVWSQKKPQVEAPTPVSPQERARLKAERKRIEAEEALEFLEYIGKNDMRVVKEEEPASNKRKPQNNIPSINLEAGMPIVEEAIRRMNMGIQEYCCSGVRVVKLIHGYGSTGKGGKIRTGVRNELAGMKRRKQIREFIAGEDFGPFDASTRLLVEQNRNVGMDPDYGRGNHGITIVVI